MDQVEKALLNASRNGDEVFVKEILTSTPDVNVNCKGRSKSNLGWSPIHLSCYFGHLAVVDLLLENRASVNCTNSLGDTPLHCAAYIGRSDIVLTLLKYNADALLVNGEGRTPSQLTNDSYIRKIIEAAEHTQKLRKNEQLLSAACSGDIQEIRSLLSSPHPPMLNYTDSLGNTALHWAAHRGHLEVVVLLLQNGVNPSLVNLRGLRAYDLAQDAKTKEILDVHPLQFVPKRMGRTEGFLLKKTRFIGWRMFWIVLDRGILSMFSRRADSGFLSRRQAYRYLDNAQVLEDVQDPLAFVVKFGNKVQLMWKPAEINDHLERERWVEAFREHARYSSYYREFPRSLLVDEIDDSFQPLGSIEEALQSSKAHQQLLSSQVADLEGYCSTIDKGKDGRPSANNMLRMKLKDISRTSQDLYRTMSHCLEILTQQEEVRRQQLEQQSEKCRVLEDALHVLSERNKSLDRTYDDRDSQEGNNSSSVESQADVFYDAEDSFLERSQVIAECSSNTETVQSPSRQCNGHSGGIYRTSLPGPMPSRADFSLWEYLKNCIGNDLSRKSMPVIFNEPLSLLQRICESLQYSHFLRRAACATDPVERLQWLGAFVVSGQSSNIGRVFKPFNPLLGETYELNREDLGINVVCEQVSHHPPISALHCKGDEFVIDITLEPKIKFWGKSVEVHSRGRTSVTFPRLGEVYSYGHVDTSVHNIIIGSIWIEHHSRMKLRSSKGGHELLLNFKPAGWFGSNPHKVDGIITDSKNEKLSMLQGDWTTHLLSYSPELHPTMEQFAGLPWSTIQDRLPAEVNVLWVGSPKNPLSSKMFDMPPFSITLNELQAEDHGRLAPTDCRYRPDIRALENGDLASASSEKARLEDKQRASRRAMNESNMEWHPRWFRQYTSGSDCDLWQYNGEYDKRDFSCCPDIY